MTPRPSLRLGLIFAALLPLLVAVAAAWGIATVIFVRTLEQRVADQLANTADVLTRTGLPFTTDLLQRVADLQQVEIALLDSRGSIVARTTGGLVARVAPLVVAGESSDGRTGGARKVDVGSESVIALHRRIQAGSASDVTTVLVAASLRDARDAARRAAFGTGLAMLAAAALLVALQYALVRGLTQPITQLVRMANQIASGRRDVRAELAPHGELQGLASALDDMTAKLAAYESELAERSRLAALGEMSARIAHEIRNPLTGLKLHLELLDERASPADRPTVRRLLDEVGRLELIVASSLSLTRPHPVALHEADLNATFEEVLSLMEPSIRHRGIELRREFGTLPPVAIDRDRIKQAVLNLVVNASDALPGGGTVLATSQHDAARGCVAISIEDSGPGFEAKPSDPVSPATGSSSKPFGLGLGLRVCREIVADHGGTLELGRSNALGGGRATIELPARAPAGPSR